MQTMHVRKTVLKMVSKIQKNTRLASGYASQHILSQSPSPEIGGFGR